MDIGDIEHFIEESIDMDEVLDIYNICLLYTSDAADD
mgnify:CR=1 FL=1